MLDFTQEEITTFFNKDISSHHNREVWMSMFSKSGHELLDKIPKNADILDVGCGKNLFKSHFPNLIGIDVIGSECDQKIALLDFTTNKKFDVVLCLGSIFGSLTDIKKQIAHIKSMLKSGGKIYWRCHPALPEWDKFPGFYYCWTENTHHQLAQEFGFTINEICKEHFLKPPQMNPRYRIYAEWTLH